MAPMQPAHWWALARVLDRDSPPLIIIRLADDHWRARLTTGDLLCLQDCLRVQDFDDPQQIHDLAKANGVRPPQFVEVANTPP